MTWLLAEHLALVGTSWLAVDRWWLCRRWHQGLNAAVADVVPWDEPATIPAVAELGRDTEKAAS